jgi:prevent-host-death family protein
MEYKNSSQPRSNMPNIRPVTDLRAHSADIARLVNDENTPVILTKNGYANMVVLSYDHYVRLNANEELYRLLADAEDDVKNGKVSGFRDFMKEIREEISNGQL